MRKNNGFISIFVLLILMPLVTFALFIIDYSKVTLAKQVISNVNDVTISNILAHYNKTLQQTYGLFGVGNINDSDTIKKNIISLMVQATRGSLTAQKAEIIVEELLNGQVDDTMFQEQSMIENSKKLTNINAIFLDKAPTMVPVYTTALNQPNILKKQIVDFMAFRGLLSLGYGFYNKVNGLKGKEKALESEKYRVSYEESKYKYVEKLKQLETLYKKLDDVVNSDNGKLVVSTQQQLKNILLTCVKEKCVNKRYNDSMETLRHLDVYSDDIVTQWQQLEGMYTKTHKTLKQWESYVESNQLSDDYKRYKSELLALSTELEQLNGQEELKKLAQLKDDWRQLYNVLQRTTINHITLNQYDDSLLEQDVVIDIENFSIGDVKRWQLFDGYKAVMSQFSKSSTTSGEVASKSVIHDITQHVQNSKLDISTVTLPNSKHIPIVKSVEHINEQNVFTKSMQVFNNSIQFISQLAHLSDNMSTFLNDLLVMEYASEMFSNYLDRQSTAPIPLSKTKLLNGVTLNVLQPKFRGAEVEYILYGKATAKENVESAINAIKLFRFGLNLMYSFTDNEIKTMIASSSLAIGPLAPLVKMLLHVLIAYCETQVDVHLLLSGKYVPIFKSSQTWIVKPTKLASGVWTLSKDYILNKINQGIDMVQTQLLHWFEQTGNNIEEKLNDVSHLAINTQVNKIMDSVYNVVQKPIITVVSSIAHTVGEHDEEQKSYYVKHLEEKWEQIIQSVENFPVAELKTPLKQLLIQHKLVIFDKIINLLSKISSDNAIHEVEKYLGELNNDIKQIVQPIVEQLESKVGQVIGEYKNKALEIIGKQVEHLSEQTKSKLYDLSQQYFGHTSHSVLGSASNQASLTTLSYPEYLKLFLLLAVVSKGDNTLVYERMAVLIGENLSLDLSKLYTAYELHTSYEVSNFFVKDWFIHDVKAKQQLITIWGY